MLITKRPFIGCIQRLTLGEELIDLKESVKCFANRESCSKIWWKIISAKKDAVIGKKALKRIHFESVIAGVTNCIAVLGTVSKPKFE